MKTSYVVGFYMERLRRFSAELNEDFIQEILNIIGGLVTHADLASFVIHQIAVQ